MTIYPDKARPFTCLICEQPALKIWESRERRAVPPLCYHCERDSGGGGGLDAQMDARLNRQINALANELQWLGNRQEYEGKQNHDRT